MLADSFLSSNTKDRLESEFSGQTAQQHGMLASVASVSLHCVYVTCNVLDTCISRVFCVGRHFVIE